MLQYLVILLDDTSTSFCHYAVSETDKRLMPLDTLKSGILFAMKENLSVQFVYSNYKLPKEYLEAIDSVDHYNIMPTSIMDSSSDALVADGWEVDVFNDVHVPIIVRTGKQDFFANYKKLSHLLRQTTRVDVMITDIDKFSDNDFKLYKEALLDLANDVETMYVEGLSPQLNILTDRMMLREMNNCGAGNTSITLAPNGKFYVCPAFYYEDAEDSCGDLEHGLDIKNKQLYELDYAPICRHCDAWQCKRCVWLNRKTTLEVNTPSHEQCVVAHIERNASMTLLRNIRKHGEFLPDFEDIKEIDYLDPFEKRKDWK